MQLRVPTRLWFLPPAGLISNDNLSLTNADSDDEEGGCPTLADLEAGLKCMATPAKASTYTCGLGCGVVVCSAVVDAALQSICSSAKSLARHMHSVGTLHHYAITVGLTAMSPLCAVGTPCSRAVA